MLAPASRSPFRLSIAQRLLTFALVFVLIASSPGAAAPLRASAAPAASASPAASSIAALDTPPTEPCPPAAPAQVVPALIYLGPTTATVYHPLALAAQLTDAGGMPLSSRSLNFALGSLSGSATTDADGLARISGAPSDLPGPTIARVSFAGDASAAAATISQSIQIARQQTLLSYLGALPGTSPTQQLRVRLADADTQQPIAGVPVQFSLGGASASATTDATGVATGTLSFSIDQALSAAALQLSFAGDAYRAPAQLSVPTSTAFPSVFGSVVVRHAPTISGQGRVEGSLRLLLGEDTALNGGAVVTGDVLVPGSPTVKLNGDPPAGGIVQGLGSPQPSNYTVTLNGHASFGRLVTRTDPIAMAAVPAPPAPSGTRDVQLSQPGQSLGDPTTLRNLTLNGNVGSVAVPPGSYGQFTANSGSTLLFGVAGATQPAVYNLQSLNLSSGSALRVAGPVVLTVASSVDLHGHAGLLDNPRWLTLNIAAGGLTLNGGSEIDGIVRATSGTVLVRGQSLLRGALFADRLTLNDGGLIDGLSAPTGSAPSLTARQLSPATALPGQSFETTLMITNTGSVSATQVLIEERFSATTPLSATASFAALTPGSTVSASFAQTAPTLAARGTGEAQAEYLSRLAAADGLRLRASGAIRYADPSGQSYPPVNVVSASALALPRLALGLSAPACVSPGSAIAYSVRVSNLGSAEATNASVHLSFPDGSSTDVALGSIAAGAVVNRTLSWTVPAIADKGHDESDAAYRNRLAAADGAQLLTRAALGWQDARGTTYGRVEQAAQTIERVPILTLTPQLPATLSPGQPVTLILNIQNSGSGTASDVQARVTNPDGTLSTATTTTIAAGQAITLQTTWVAPSVARTTTETDAEYQARLAALDAVLTFNVALDWADGASNRYGPISASAQATTLSPPILTIALAGAASVRPNETITYTVTVRNSGRTPAEHMSVVVLLPNGTVQPLDTGEQLAPGEQRSIALPFTIPLAGIADSITARATVTWQDSSAQGFGPITAAVTSTVIDAAPVAAPDAYTIAAGSILTVTLPGLLANDYDPDGHPLSAVLVSEPAHGALAFVGNGAFVYAPDSGFTGTDRFTYHATDGLRASEPASVEISVATPPTATPSPTASPTPTATPATSTPTPAPITLIDSQTQGYYNSAIGTILDGTDRLFPRANLADGDPTINPAPEPNLAAAAAVLGDWLAPNPLPLNANWSGPRAIPLSWPTNNENAILYVVDAGPSGIANIRGNFGVDNGVFVWVNGHYKFGAMAPGGAPAFEYANIDLGSLSPGLNYIQILREDHGGGTGFAIKITGTPIEQIPTATATPVSTATPLPTTTPPPEETLAVPGWLGSPANGSSVSGLVPITLASGITLQSGTIDYWPADDPSAITVLASNLSGSGGATLATLDTTTLANGSYIIRLQGTDSGGTQLNSGVLITVVGEYKPGRVRFSVTDLTVPITGLPITIGRTYDSLESGRSGDFGYGWSLSVGSPRLEVDPANNVTITQPDGRRTTFYFTPRSVGGFFGFLLQPGYTAEPGVYGSLTADGCGLLVSSGGKYVCFLDTPAYSPTLYTYTDPYGRVSTMGSDGSLKSIRDLGGNTLTFSAGGISSSAGDIVVPFVRDSQGRITQITDPAGNRYSYSYDAQGNLETVQLGDGGTITHTYDSTHLLTGATDPRGHNMITTSYYPDGRLRSQTDALGNTTGFAYDVSGDVTTQTNPDGGVVITRQDSYGKPLSETDALGRTTTYTYDAQHNLLIRRNAAGETIGYSYDSRGNTTTVTDELGQHIQLTYNSFNTVISSIDPLGNPQWASYTNAYPSVLSDTVGIQGTFEWNTRGNLLSSDLGDGNATRYTYDSYGNRTSSTNPLGQTTRYTYDELGRPLSMTDPLGATSTYRYDALGRELALIDPLGQIASYTYDANGNRTGETDPARRTTRRTYDAANNLSAVIYPDGSTTTYAYDFRGNVISETDQLGHTTLRTYDKAGQLTSETVAANTSDAATTTYTYDAAGRLLRRTDALGHTTTKAYDAAGHLLRDTDPLGHATSYGYDANGQQVVMTDTLGLATRYTYDARGRMTTITYADGTTTRKTYDPAAHVTSVTDQAGRTTTYTYDGAGYLAAVRNPLGQTTSYAYDAAGHRTSITDANGHVTSSSYDALARLTRKTLPDGSYESYTYDAGGNLQSLRLGDGNVNNFSYDLLGQLRRIDYFDGQAVSYTYTLNGQRASVSDTRGTTTYQYDGQDRLLAVTQPDGRHVSYSYDAIGQRQSLTVQAGAIQHVTSYGYDAAGHLTTITDPSGASTTISYNNRGQPTRRALPNGISTDYSYDTLARLTSVTNRNGSNVLTAYVYTLGPAGNRLRETEQNGGSTRTTSWSYDAAYRLMNETISVNGSVAAQYDYTYDAVGNRLTKTLDGAQATAYTYNALDQLTSDGLHTYSYDGRGNQTSVSAGTEITRYRYDAANQLTRAELPAGAVDLTYDADGHVVHQTAGTAVANFLWDEASTNGDIVLETDGSGAELASYALADDQQLYQSQAGQSSYAVPDGLGNVRELTNTSGALTDHYQYDAYGTTLEHTGASANPYQYRGQRRDDTTDLYNLRARYYDPASGRFLSRDTAEVNTYDPTELNRYGYARANPVDYSDPSGLEAAIEYSTVAATISLAPIVEEVKLGIKIACMYTYILTVVAAVAKDTAALERAEKYIPMPCRIATFHYPASRTPEITAHDKFAIFGEGAPPEPGAGTQVGGFWPMLLARHGLGGKETNRKRRAACGSAPSPRPAGQSCDEYPFGSTMMGGGGASWRLVPAWENSLQEQGRIIGDFHRTVEAREFYAIVFDNNYGSPYTDHILGATMDIFTELGFPDFGEGIDADIP